MLLLALAALSLTSAGKTSEPSARIFEFRSGVIVDAERAIVYLMTPEPGIDAVDLASGKVLWRTDQAAKPLWRHQNLLVAQTEPTAEQKSLRIAMLNSQDIAADPRFVDIPLPADVRATIDDGMESSFGVTARVHEEGLVLSWQYRYRRMTGARSESDDQASDRTYTDNILIDTHTGQIDSIDQMAVRPEPELPPAVARLKDAQALPGRVWRVGDLLVVIVRATLEGSQHVSLKRWNAETGEALADVTLFDRELSFRSVSADQRHLLASRRRASDSRVWEWAVFSLETGAKVAELRHDSPGARFFLSGPRLIHETNVTRRQANGQMVVKPAELRAIDLGTGRELWSHAIRDTAYRGPYQPGSVP